MMPPGTLYALFQRAACRAGAEACSQLGNSNKRVSGLASKLLEREATSGRKAAIHRYLHMGAKFEKTRGAAQLRSVRKVRTESNNRRQRRRALAHRLPPSRRALAQIAAHVRSRNRASHEGLHRRFSCIGNVSSSEPALAQCVAGLQESSAYRAGGCRWRASSVPKKQTRASYWVQLSFSGSAFQRQWARICR